MPLMLHLRYNSFYINELRITNQTSQSLTSAISPKQRNAHICENHPSFGFKVAVFINQVYPMYIRIAYTTSILGQSQLIGAAMKTTIVKWGNSQGIRLPKHLLESADINAHDPVEVMAENHRIIIKQADRKPHKTIQERFQGFTGTYAAETVDWGCPAGKEIW